MLYYFYKIREKGTKSSPRYMNRLYFLNPTQLAEAFSDFLNFYYRKKDCDFHEVIKWFILQGDDIEDYRISIVFNQDKDTVPSYIYSKRRSGLASFCHPSQGEKIREFLSDSFFTWKEQRENY